MLLREPYHDTAHSHFARVKLVLVTHIDATRAVATAIAFRIFATSILPEPSLE